MDTTTIENPLQCWGTPQALFDVLNREFLFDLDAAANFDNAKCDKWVGPGSPFQKDTMYGLVSCHCCVFAPRIWLNPPFNNIAPFLGLLLDDLDGYKSTWVCLLPNDTSTQWYRDYVTKADEVRHLIGPRLQFELPEGYFECVNCGEFVCDMNAWTNELMVFCPKCGTTPTDSMVMKRAVPSQNDKSNIIAIFRPRPVGKPQLKWDWDWRADE